MIQVYKPGVRGFLIADLQRSLATFLGEQIEGGADGHYGVHTQQGVQRAWHKVISAGASDLTRRLTNEGAGEGFAGEALFATVGMEWPEDFARCLMLTMDFEGTGFPGAEGPKQTGDHFGVTHGAIGFTSGNGELQALLRDAGHQYEESFYAAAKSCFTDDKVRLAFYNAIAEGCGAGVFATWALTSEGNVRPELKCFLSALAEMEWYRRLQMSWAYYRYWMPACEQAAALSTEGPPTLRMKALLFEVWVQDGGLHASELQELKLMFAAQGCGLTERQRMGAISACVVGRVRSHAGPVDDVRSRKETICAGAGEVHGAQYDLEAWAL